MTWYMGTSNTAYGSVSSFTSSPTGLSFTMEFPKANNGEWVGTKSDVLAANTFEKYESMTFSLDVATTAGAPDKGVALFANLYYLESGTTSLSLLGSKTVTNITSVSQNLSFDMSESAMATLNKAGQFYVVVGNTTGSAWSQVTVSNMTFTGSFTAPVPEPATATLSLLGLACVAWRRRRVA